ncbi:MAG: helix-turn-helix domain-containing protein [Moraxellaceae bacterium]
MSPENRDDDYTQVAGWLRPFSQAAESQGLDSVRLFQEVGVDMGLMHEAGARLPSRKVDKLWRQAFADGADLAFGLDYAHHFQPGNLYVLSFGIFSSLNLQQASEHLLLPLRLLTYGAVVKCYCSQDEFHIEVASAYPGAVHEKQIFFHAVLLRIWRALAHTTLSPARLELFGIAEPEDSAVWARICQYFDCPVIFNAELSRLSLPLSVARAPLQAANAALVEQSESIIQRYVEELDAQRSVHDVVRKVINKLSSGHYDRASVAEELGISTSTLQRRLAAEGTSFSQLLNNTRRDLAERYLRESRRPIKEVAYSLGFADLSNFTRAFRNWFGVSPREFRRQTFPGTTD